MNIVHNLHRYVEKLQVPSEQLFSELYKTSNIVFHSKFYISVGTWIEYIWNKKWRANRNEKTNDEDNNNNNNSINSNNTLS